jgi:hypothetical protein
VPDHVPDDLSISGIKKAAQQMVCKQGEQHYKRWVEGHISAFMLGV